MKTKNKMAVTVLLINVKLITWRKEINWPRFYVCGCQGYTVGNGSCCCQASFPAGRRVKMQFRFVEIPVW